MILHYKALITIALAAVMSLPFFGCDNKRDDEQSPAPSQTESPIPESADEAVNAGNGAQNPVNQVQGSEARNAGNGAQNPANQVQNSDANSADDAAPNSQEANNYKPDFTNYYIGEPGLEKPEFRNVLSSPISVLDVNPDTEAYSIFRYYIQKKRAMPNRQLLRTEMLINYFRYNYPEPEDNAPFAFTTELVTTPWNSNTQLLLIGMQTAKSPNVPRSNIVYLVDISGSMSDRDKLSLFRRSIQKSLSTLTQADTVSIVTYAGGEKVILSGANPILNKTKIEDALISINPYGYVEGKNGLKMAYQEAARHFVKGGNNRIILVTDGDLNVGISDEKELNAFVSKKRSNGVSLSVWKFGFTHLRDRQLKELADSGNGSYHFIDTPEDAVRSFIDDRDSVQLQTSKDAAFQIEFNPKKAKEYRLIGYESHKTDKDVPDEPNAPRKDSGELSSNHQMTVLYEIVPAGTEINVAETDSPNPGTESIPNDALAVLTARYKLPNKASAQEIKIPVSNQVSPRMSENIQFAGAVAEVGMMLNNSEFKGTSSYESAHQILSNLKSVQSDPDRTDFLGMVQLLSSFSVNQKGFENQQLHYEEQQREYEKQSQKQLEEDQNQLLEAQKYEEERLKFYEEHMRTIDALRTSGIVLRVKMLPPKVNGSLDKRIIQKVVRQHSGELRACYERVLLKKKNLAGRIIVIWLITRQGDVSKAFIKESTIRNKDLEKCITSSIKFWRFPSPKGGDVVQVEFPFEFVKERIQ